MPINTCGCSTPTCGCQNSTPCYTAQSTCPQPACTACTSTINTDCVVYNDARLPFELGTVTLGEPRILTSVLQQLAAVTGTNDMVTIKFNKGYVTQPILNTYIVATPSTFIVNSLLDINGMAAYYSIVLPGTTGGPSAEAFKNVTLRFINVSTTNPANGITFNTGIKIAFSPTVSSNADFLTLANARGSATVVDIVYIPTALGVYEWVLV